MDFQDRNFDRVIGYKKDHYTCQVDRSPNGEWVVASTPTTESVADSERTVEGVSVYTPHLFYRRDDCVRNLFKYDWLQYL